MDAVDNPANKNENTPAPPSFVARALTPWLGAALAIIGIIWASGILVDIGIALITEQVICGVLGLTFAIVYLNVSARGQVSVELPWYDGLAALVGFILGWYLFFRYPTLLDQIAYMPKESTIVGFLLIILTAEALRRTAGWGLLCVLLVFFVYGLFGHFVPGTLSGRSLEIGKFFSYLGIDTNALLGTPLIIIFTVVVVFIFLGQVLLRSGGSEFFTDLAAALMGHSRGGSA